MIRVYDATEKLFNNNGIKVIQPLFAEITKIDFLPHSLSEEECRARYATTDDTKLLYNAYSEYGLFPTSSAYCFAKAVKLIQEGADEVVVYNEYFGATPVVLRVKCVG